MQSRRPNLRAASLVAVVALLLATPALAAPPTGAASWAGFPDLAALWTRVAGAFGGWFGANGEQIDPDGAPGWANSSANGPASVDRVTGANGEEIDPDGTPQSTGTWTGASAGSAAAGSGGTDPNG